MLKSMNGDGGCQYICSLLQLKIFASTEHYAKHQILKNYGMLMNYTVGSVSFINCVLLIGDY